MGDNPRACGILDLAGLERRVGCEDSLLAEQHARVDESIATDLGDGEGFGVALGDRAGERDWRRHRFEIFQIEDGLVVKTESDPVVRGRKLLLQLMWARAPGVTALRKYGARYGISEVKAVQDYGLIDEEGAARFKKEPTFCVLCGLCVRYCAEVKKENAIGFIGKGTEREVAFFPEIARRACPSCQKCFGLCPTGLLQDQYTLVQMARPAETKTKTAKQ